MLRKVKAERIYVPKEKVCEDDFVTLEYCSKSSCVSFIKGQPDTCTKPGFESNEWMCRPDYFSEMYRRATFNELVMIAKLGLIQIV